MQTFLVFAACVFASSYSLRLIDPLVLPVAAHFDITAARAALLSPAYALPYAIAQPFLGPISDRLGRVLCIQVCIAGLAVTLWLGAFAGSFGLLLGTRIAAGMFAGGLVPLVLAAIGDAYDMSKRQVMLGRMLFALISGQMLGSLIAGLASGAFGWRTAMLIAAVLALAATVLAWRALPRRTGEPDPQNDTKPSFRTLYGRVFGNPKAAWLLGAVFVEGVLFFAYFPYVSDVLSRRGPGVDHGAAARQAGFVLGAFGIGGLLYTLNVRRLITGLGVRRMCLVASVLAAAATLALSVVTTWWQAAVAATACGLSFYMIHNSLQTEATELAPGARGSAVALFASALFLGQGMGPLLFGPAIEQAGDAAAFLVIAAGLALLGQLVVRRIVGARGAPHR